MEREGDGERDGGILTEVRLVWAALQSHSFLRALDQEVSDQLSGQVSHCRTDSTGGG